MGQGTEHFDQELRPMKTDHDKEGTDSLFFGGTPSPAHLGVFEQIKTRPGTRYRHRHTKPLGQGEKSNK